MEGAQLVQSLVEHHLASVRSLEAALCSLVRVWASGGADQNRRCAALQLGFPSVVALAVDRLKDAAVMSTAGEQSLSVGYRCQPSARERSAFGEL